MQSIENNCRIPWCFFSRFSTPPVWDFQGNKKGCSYGPIPVPLLQKYDAPNPFPQKKNQRLPLQHHKAVKALKGKEKVSLFHHFSMAFAVKLRGCMFGMCFYLKKQNWCRNFTENVPNLHSPPPFLPPKSQWQGSSKSSSGTSSQDGVRTPFIFQSVGANSQQYLKFLHSLKAIVHTCQEATTPNGNDHLPSIHFQVRTLTFVGGKFSGWVKWGTGSFSQKSTLELGIVVFLSCDVWTKKLEFHNKKKTISTKFLETLKSSDTNTPVCKSFLRCSELPCMDVFTYR